MKLVAENSDILKTKIEIEPDPQSLATLSLDLLDLLKGYQAVGLAAPQVGLARRLFVMRVAGQDYRCANPEYQPLADHKQAMEEGCVTFRNLWVRVPRWPQIQARWWDPIQGPKEQRLEGLAAQCFQHEWDHLEGLTLRELTDHRQWLLAQRQRMRRSPPRRP